jgi:DnaD/phage-associated family protein
MTNLPRGFSGFPAKAGGSVQIPNMFFSELLPQIDDLGELKVTIHCFWAVQQREGKYRYVGYHDLVSDALFMRGLAASSVQAETILKKALESATIRGTLLHIVLNGEDIYFINTARGRSAIGALERGDWVPDPNQKAVALVIERPNIFTLYEQNIGPLTPLLSDSLRDVEATYPADWIVEAITIAVKSNKRQWRYIEAVLKRWATEGKESYNTPKETPTEEHPYLQDEYFTRQRDDE